jgi:hypothetical protein
MPLPVSVGDFMLTARFHPHLLAARLGAIGVYTDGGFYYKPKHGSIIRLGSPFVLAADSLPVHPQTNPSRSFRPMMMFDSERVAQKLKTAEYIYG